MTTVDATHGPARGRTEGRHLSFGPLCAMRPEPAPFEEERAAWRD